jgi:hypothetical protein
MQSKSSSIAIASTFLLGVAAWYGARYWTFGQFHTFFIIPFVLAIALATSVVRGDVFSRWLTFVFGVMGVYASFNLFLHLRSKVIIVNSEEITGEAFILPGAFFSLCSAILFAAWLAGYLRKRQTTE